MKNRRIDAVHFIEDSDDEVFLTKLLFSREKVQPKLSHYTSYSGFTDALDAIAPDEPLLVCVDLNMPGMKGTEIISKVLSRERRPQLIMGICSGSEDPADKMLAKRVGARFFVQKPLNRAALEGICALVDELNFEVTNENMFTLSCNS